VPLAFINDDIAVGVKMNGGTVTPLMNELEISCLPKNLPERIEVDVEALELDQMLYLEDIVLPEGVELSLLTQEEPVNEPIVAVRLLQIQEEEPEVEELLEGEEGDEAETEGEESSESEGASEDSQEE
jgi:large subunit ribosomal protein L25